VHSSANAHVELLGERLAKLTARSVKTGFHCGQFEPERGARLGAAQAFQVSEHEYFARRLVESGYRSVDSVYQLPAFQRLLRIALFGGCVL